MTAAMQQTNPYVAQALATFVLLYEKVTGEPPSKRVKGMLIPILERLHDDSYNEGQEADRRPL